MKKAILYGVLIALIVGGFVFREIYNNRQIVKLAEEAQAVDLENQALKKTVLVQDGKIKLADVAVRKAEGDQKVAKLSLVDQGKIFDEEMESINGLREADQEKFEITNDKWNKVLLEKKKYQQQVINLDIKWQAVSDKKDKKILALTVQVGNLKDQVFKLEKNDLRKNKIIIRLSKDQDKWFIFPTANFDFMKLDSAGPGYFSAGIGGSIDLKKLFKILIKGKLSITNLIGG